MDCSCTVEQNFDDCETSRILRIDIPKARKEHHCQECGRVIPKGEEYIVEAMVHEGIFSQHKTCEDCYAVRQVFFSSGWWYGGLWDDMREFIIDCDGDLSVSCIRQLTPRARGIVCDLIEKQWEQG